MIRLCNADRKRDKNRRHTGGAGQERALPHELLPLESPGHQVVEEILSGSHTQNELFAYGRQRGDRVTFDVPDGPVADGADAIKLCRRHRGVTRGPSSKLMAQAIAYPLPPSSPLFQPKVPSAERMSLGSC